jgi:hypothetical protein
VADSGNPEDLVSQVKVLGTEESAAKLDAYAASGAKSFEKLNVAAQVSAKGVESAAAKIDRAGSKAGAGFAEFDTLGSRLSLVPGHLKNIEVAISKVSQRLPQLTQALGRFSQRLALVGAAAVASGVGLASAASKIAKAVGGTTDAVDQQTQAQIASNNASLQAETATINLESSQRKLLEQVGKGEISYRQYNDQVVQLNKDYREQQRVAFQVEQAQERVRLENERLTKQAANTKAFQAQVDMFGGPLLSSMIQLGNQATSLFASLKNTFGPVIAKGIDLITSSLTSNGQSIGSFFDSAAAKLDALIVGRGPQIQALFSNIAKAASAVFIGIIDAAPGVIDFFNNVLVPALTKVGALFTGLAKGINSIFGTQLTGGSIVLIAILAQMTGSLRLIFALLRSSKVIFNGLISVITQVGIAVAEVFGFKTAAKLVAFGGAASKMGGPFSFFLGLIRAAIPLISTLGTTLAAALGIGFGPALIIIGLLTAALIFLITKVDWTKFAADASAALTSVGQFLTNLLNNAKIVVAAVIATFQEWNAFFNSLPGIIGQALLNLWNGIVERAKAAVEFVKAAWNGLLQYFTDLAVSIGTFFTDLWNNIVNAAKAVPGLLQAVWDAIKQAVSDTFDAVVAAVKQAFVDLYNTAKAKLLPIIDWLKAIIALLPSAGGTTDTKGAVRAAGGGHIRGRGTSTSDSIPAWLSNNEYVIRARAVGKYGVGLMNAINSGRFKVPKFNAGGLVSSMIAPAPRLAFAAGGPVGGSAALRPINLSLFGEQFEGLMAPEDVGERLTKFAVSRQNRSTGRKPAWVGRGRN